MNKKITTLLLALLPFVAFAQVRKNLAYQDYINQYKYFAIEEMLKYNIPASITLAQGILESGAGQSDLARKGNNHFGIKCHDWNGRTTYHDDDTKNECFRAYNSVLESYEDHSNFLRSKPRYASLFNLDRTDYKGWAFGLKEAGYATNPQYAYSLINIIEAYELQQYDRATTSNLVFPKQNTNRVVANPDEHIVRMCNKNYYVVARQGDTFHSIGKEFGTTAKKLAQFNECDINEVLGDGDIVYLKKKRSKADKAFQNKPHLVKAGESLYTISQKYGITLKSLYKMNGLPSDFELTPGEHLRIY